MGLSEVQTPLIDEESAIEGSVQGLVSELEEVQYGTLSTPFRLVAQSVLRADGVADGRVVQELPAGVQVFPLSREGDWVQVVVPARQSTEIPVKASFGWLPEKQGGGRLLEKDKEPHVVRRSWTGPEKSQEQVEAKWDEVRSKNTRLKRKLAELEVWMQNSNADRARMERERGVQAARAKVTEVINVQELSKSVGSLQKELKKPSHLLSKVGGL